MRSRWPGRIVASLLCAAVVAAVAWSFRPLPVEVDLATVSRGDVLVTVDEEGRTRVRERYVVATPIGGRLRRVGLHVGDPVRRGETLLAVVDPRLPDPLDERERLRAEAQVGAARASLERTRSAVERAVLDLEHARRESDRMRRAASAAAAPGRELDLALQAERLAAEDLRSTEHARRIAEFDLALAQAAFAVSVPRDGDPPPPAPFEIRSPIDGAVLRVTLESESVVTPGAAILEVGDPADLEVTVEVLTRDAVRVVPGAEVVFTQWGGATPLEGRIRRIEPAGFTKVSALGVEEQRVLVIADLLDPPSRRATLGDAYRVEAHILVDAARGVLTAPAGALFRSGPEWAVFLAAGETVELRTVTTGRSDGRATEIVAGLSEGDRVVLHPGAEVAPGVAFVERSRAPR